MPRRILNLSDDFYGGLGRVAALGALVELRLSNVIVLWGHDANDEGKPIHHLSKRFESIRKARIEAGYEFPVGLIDAVATATDAMAERNELLHSMWPGEASGWRNRPGGTVPLGRRCGGSARSDRSTRCRSRRLGSVSSLTA